MKIYNFFKKANIEQEIRNKHQKTIKMLRVAGILAAILILSCVFALLPQSVRAVTVTATVTVGANPFGVAVTPNGAYVYVANEGGNSVSVIDTPSFAVSVTQGSHGTIAPSTTIVNYGGSQEFTFTPATGYHIVAIIVNGTTVATTSPYTISDVTGPTSLTAEYAIDVFTVTVGDHTHGSISSTNGTSVNYGDDLSFSVTPDAGYHLVSVLIDGQTASAPYNFVGVTADHTISATFAIDVFTVTVGDYTHGSISSANGTSV